MLILGIISAVLGIAGLILAIIFTSGWTLVVLVAGTAVLIIGAVFSILTSVSAARWIRTTGIIVLSVGGAICLIGLTLLLTPTIGTNNNNNDNSSTTIITSENATVPATTPNTTYSNVPIVDPAIEHGTYPQTQIGHPNYYVETGTDKTFTWTFQVKTGEVGIVGGNIVDGIVDGVYRAYPVGTHTVTVTNGFVLTTITQWSYNEFWFRVGQAVEYKWDHCTIDTAGIIEPLQ